MKYLETMFPFSWTREVGFFGLDNHRDESRWKVIHLLANIIGRSLWTYFECYGWYCTSLDTYMWWILVTLLLLDEWSITKKLEWPCELYEILFVKGRNLLIPTPNVSNPRLKCLKITCCNIILVNSWLTKSKGDRRSRIGQQAPKPCWCCIYI